MEPTLEGWTLQGKNQHILIYRYDEGNAMTVTEARYADDALRRAAECLKVIAHPDRLRIIELLARGPLAVHEVADECGLAQHVACGHLRLLTGHGLLESQRNGRFVTYRIADPRLPRILDCVKNCRVKPVRRRRR